MLSVDKINKLEYYNNKMINLLTHIKDILIDGVEHEVPYYTIDKVLDLIDKLDEEVSNDYKKMSSM